MKDECTGCIMTHFIGLRSKMYCAKIEGQEPIKRDKGIKSCVVKTKITYEDYYKCSFDDEIAVREQRTIRTRLHNLYTEKELKVVLSGHDDKCYLLPNSTNTLAWGHYRIPTVNERKEKEEPPRKRMRN